MALRKSTVTPHGFEASAAYHRVENITFESKEKIRFVVRSYKDKDSTPQFNEQMFECDYALEGMNPFAQAYGFLKTTPQYLGSEDC